MIGYKKTIMIKNCYITINSTNRISKGIKPLIVKTSLRNWQDVESQLITEGFKLDGEDKGLKTIEFDSNFMFDLKDAFLDSHPKKYLETVEKLDKLEATELNLFSVIFNKFNADEAIFCLKINDFSNFIIKSRTEIIQNLYDSAPNLPSLIKEYIDTDKYINSLIEDEICTHIGDENYLYSYMK